MTQSRLEKLSMPKKMAINVVIMAIFIGLAVSNVLLLLERLGTSLSFYAICVLQLLRVMVLGVLCFAVVFPVLKLTRRVEIFVLLGYVVIQISQNYLYWKFFQLKPTVLNYFTIFVWACLFLLWCKPTTDELADSATDVIRKKLATSPNPLVAQRLDLLQERYSSCAIDDETYLNEVEKIYVELGINPEEIKKRK